MVRDEQLDFWIEHGYNALFIGKHGVGKTAVIKAAMARKNLNWVYFSASTMDPWVDLVGVPVRRQDEHGEYLDLVRMRGLDKVEAFFFDEFNRSHKKIRNAVMELIQFRSINGKKFPNLKLVWAAINPDDDETYDVEKLDPAQRSRFHVTVHIPYECNAAYFSGKYGSSLSRGALSWWKDLPENIKKDVSPRTLDYALDIYTKGGDVRYSLPEKCNVTKLLHNLRNGPIEDTLKDLLDRRDVESARKLLSNQNDFQTAIDHIKRRNDMKDFFLPLLDSERRSVVSSERGMLQYMLDRIQSVPEYQETIKSIWNTKTDEAAIKTIRRVAAKSVEVAKCIDIGFNAEIPQKWSFGVYPEDPTWGVETITVDEEYTRVIAGLVKEAMTHMRASMRKVAYDTVLKKLPSYMTMTQARNTLDFLNAVANWSRDTSFSSLDRIMGVINHCLGEIARHRGITMKETVATELMHRSSLWRKIERSRDLSARLCIEGGRRTA